MNAVLQGLCEPRREEVHLRALWYQLERGDHIQGSGLLFQDHHGLTLHPDTDGPTVSQTARQGVLRSDGWTWIDRSVPC